MTKSKNTKRALLTSVLSLMLCAAMLVGSTFAWFTDNVTSGKNRIVAGNLDVELSWSEDGTTWTRVEENTNMFEGALWEPGYTRVVYLKVENVGSLALKYKFGINVAGKTIGYTADGQPIDLSQYIKFGVVDNAPIYTLRTAALAAVEDSAVLVSAGYASTEATLSANAESNPIALVVYMPEATGNAANHGFGKQAPSIDLGINLVATQDAVESDSFGDDYDAEAEYPVATQTDFVAALNEATEGDRILLSEGEYALPAENYSIPAGVSIIGESGAKLIVKGNNAANIEAGCHISADNVTISNVEIIGENLYPDFDLVQYSAFVRITGDNVTLDNVTIDASRTNVSPIVIGNTKGADNTITIKNCNINAHYKAIHIVDGTLGTIKIDGCNIDAIYPFNVNTTSTLSMEVTNSVLNGWTSYGDSVTKVTFDNCEFGEGHGYGYVVAYADTDFINCRFAPGFYAQTKDERSRTMTFTNCSMGETPITAANVKEKFHADNDSDSIDQAHGWTVIVDGTTVETLK